MADGGNIAPPTGSGARVQGASGAPSVCGQRTGTEGSARIGTGGLQGQVIEIHGGEQARSLQDGRSACAQDLLTMNVFPGISGDGEEVFHEADEAPEDVIENLLAKAVEAQSLLRSGTETAIGNDPDVEVGTGEARNQVRQQARAQQSLWGLWGAGFSGVWNAVAATVVTSAEVVDSYMNSGVSGPGTHGAPGAAPASSSAGTRAVTPATSETVAAKAQARALAIAGQVEQAMAKLNQQLHDNYRMPELAIPRKAGSIDAPLQAWDHAVRWGHRALGIGAAGMEAAGWVALTATLQGVVSAAPMSMGANIAATAGSIWLGLGALLELPDKANAQAALSHVNSELKKIQPLADELKGLIEHERLRHMGESRMLLVSMERERHIHALAREMTQVENALAATQNSSLEIGESLEPSAALGDGRVSQQIRDQAENGRSAFQFFFSALLSGLASIGRAVSRAGVFLADLPNLFSRQSSSQESERREAERLEAVQAEKLYAGEYSNALSALSSRRESSRIDLLDDPLVRMEQEGYGTEEKLLRRSEVTRQLHRGENLARLVGGSEEFIFRKVKVTSIGAPPVSHAIPSSVLLTRDLASYFSLVASKPGSKADGVDVAVARNSDGSLTVDDRNGHFFSFLMSVPSAYSDHMARLKSGQPAGCMTIDDHSAGFPGGARSMRFERVLALDQDGAPALDDNGQAIFQLRVEFLTEQPWPVYAPLVNEHKLMADMAMLRQIAIRAGQDQASPDAGFQYSSRTPEELKTHLAELSREYEHAAILLQIEQKQFGELQNWKAPDARNLG